MNPNPRNFRLFNLRQDKKNLIRIWRDARWIKTDKEQEKIVDYFFQDSEVWVGELNKRAETAVCVTPATIQHQETKLDLCAVASVASSFVARRQGQALALTAHALCSRAVAGDKVAMLGIFDQGFYDRLGFSSGPYIYNVQFDPQSLRVSGAPPIPSPLSTKDWKAIYDARLQSLECHGNCIVKSPGQLRASLLFMENSSGLGYYDSPGKLGHHFWGHGEGEYGPFEIWWLHFRNRDELYDLLRLIKAMGDQMCQISLYEPPEIQFQDLIDTPFRHQTVTEGSKMETKTVADAFSQIRILDLEACIASFTSTKSLSFSLVLDDPIVNYLPKTAPWRGVSGEYTVNFGPESSVCKGCDSSLPILRCGVGAFSRLWHGSSTAQRLFFAKQIEAPASLIEDLDRVIELPLPHRRWDF